MQKGRVGGGRLLSGRGERGERMNGRKREEEGHTLIISVNVAVNPRPRISPRIPLCASQNDLLTNAAKMMNIAGTIPQSTANSHTGILSGFA